jgi:hypothetical protein
VQSKYFQIKFGIRPAEGPAEQSRIDNVSANVVSVLQGGAFFGALSSAPVSGRSRVFPQLCSPCAMSFLIGFHCGILASPLMPYAPMEDSDGPVAHCQHFVYDDHVMLN